MFSLFHSYTYQGERERKGEVGRGSSSAWVSSGECSIKLFRWLTAFRYFECQIFGPNFNRFRIELVKVWRGEGCCWTGLFMSMAHDLPNAVAVQRLDVRCAWTSNITKCNQTKRNETKRNKTNAKKTPNTKPRTRYNGILRLIANSIEALLVYR